MLYSVEHIGEILKQARLKKGLSQRDLSLKISLPQSHISKIERGQVDLQASSLIELSRILDLELMLIPKTLVPAVQALQRGDEKLHSALPMYQIEQEESDG